MKDKNDTCKRPTDTCTHEPKIGKFKRKQGACLSVNPAVICKNKCTIEPIEHNSDAELINLPDTTTPVQPLMNQATLAQPLLSARLGLGNDTPLIERAVLITPPTTGTVPTQTTRPLAALLRQTEQLLEINEFGDENIDYNTKDMFAPFRDETTDKTADPLDNFRIT